MLDKLKEMTGGDAKRMQLYLETYADADLFLSEMMETAEGPLPPPSPQFYTRFGGLQ